MHTGAASDKDAAAIGPARGSGSNAVAEFEILQREGACGGAHEKASLR